MIGELTGRVQTEQEFNSNSGDQSPLYSPYLVAYKPESSTNLPTICIAIDGSNNLRYMRKSCRPNVRLRHSIDSEGNVHFDLIAAATSNENGIIHKSDELTLPINDAALASKYPPSSLVCFCGGSSNCPLANIDGVASNSNSQSNSKRFESQSLFYIIFRF